MKKIMRSFKFSALLASLLSACDFYEPVLTIDELIELGRVESRQCPGFYHPEFAAWMPEESEGNVVSFSDRSGRTALFTAGALIRSEPFSKSGEPGDSLNEIDCELTAQRAYTASFPYPQLGFEYAHIDLGSSAIGAEPLLLTLKFKTNEGSDLPQQFQVYLLSESAQDGANSLRETEYFTVLSVNGVEYPNVLSQRLTGNISDALTASNARSEDTVVKVLVAKEVGLLQFELADGSVYSRNL